MEGEIAKRNRCGNRFNHSNFRTFARNGEIDYLIQKLNNDDKRKTPE